MDGVEGTEAAELKLVALVKDGADFIKELYYEALGLLLSKRELRS